MRRVTLAVCALVCLALATGGCAAINDMMASWQGHDFNELIANWGPPQQVFDDGSGGRIFVYATNRSWSSPGYATSTTGGHVDSWGNINAYTTTTYQPPEKSGYTAYRMFWINSSGTIYRWAWRGV